MRTGRTVGSVIVITAVLGAAIACVLADPPPIDPLPPATRPTILTDIVAPRPDQRLTSEPVTFTIPVAVDPNQTIEWRMFMDLDPVNNTVQAMDVTDDGGVTDLADAGNAVRVITISQPFTGLDFSACHTFTYVVAFHFDGTTFSKPEDVPGCVSCGTSVTWFYEPVSDCTYDDAAPPTYMAEAGDGAAE
jgi:hypothetical protein